MTREEAINELKTIYLGDSEQARNAKEMAIRSLEAWDNVMEDLHDYGINFQMANRFDLSSVVIQTMRIIEKHLKEVEE